MTRTEQVAVSGALKGCVVALSVAVLAGCASSDAAKILNPDPPSQMYADADALMSRGKFHEAFKKFEDVDREHPYSPEARRAIVMAAYAYYKAGKLPEAIASAERYTTMHPGTKEAPLAHHIIASSYFDQMRQPDRDQTATRKALAQLKTLKTRYPDSKYAREADNRIRLAEDTLAAAEMEVGRYYMKQDNFVAAINRFKAVVVSYQTTAHVEEALYRLTASYLSLGIASEAQSAAAVLGHNFPSSRWYKESFALLQEQGLKPEVNSGSWMYEILKPGQTPEAQPEPTPEPPQQVPPTAQEPLPEPPPGPLPPLSLGGPAS
ncbi:MAG: outer membrane protein assembly factor BamD [Hyphomicrobium sp.]